MPTITLPINPGSDGDGGRRPKTDDFDYNDEYWLLRVGEAWAKHRGNPTGPGYTYRLDRLPDGYAGYEKARSTDPKHVDRYVYGHARGPARSVPDFLPHFIYLMDNGDARGCHCRLCVEGPRTKASGGTAGGLGTSSQYSRKPAARASRPRSSFPPPPKPLGRSSQARQQPSPESDPPPPCRRNQVDEEGTPDTLRLLLNKLKEASPEGKVDERFVEMMSPDWRTGHMHLMKELKAMSELPGYVPRKGELVMFVRDLEPHETLGWDEAAQTWRVLNTQRRTWADRKGWSAGVVAQVPDYSQESNRITDEDLSGTPENKQYNVVYSGYRIEPLPQPNSVDKSYTKQHKYVPLHAIRPLALWKECLQGAEEKDWPPAVRHALTVASSMCILGKYHFKGTWPTATIFVQGIYIGPELIIVGDAVRLHNRHELDAANTVTDVLVVTAIKFRIVNLDEASDDDYDEGRPYNTCTHISGSCYTQNPMRSYDGAEGLAIAPDSEQLPDALKGLGTWYHVTDPNKTKVRMEVPFQRVIGRVYEGAAMKAWFTPPTNIDQSPSFQAVNTKPTISLNDTPMSTGFSRGLPGILEARAYSQKHDIRIDRDLGKTWFWADTRVQQLDVHEVNGVFVGIRNDERDSKQMQKWRACLKALDGKKGGLAEYHAARVQKGAQQVRRESAMGASASGLVAGGAQACAETTEAEGTSGDKDESEDDQNAMEAEQPLQQEFGPPQGFGDMVIDDEEDDSGGDALAAFKAAPAAAARKETPEVIMLGDD